MTFEQFPTRHKTGPPLQKISIRAKRVMRDAQHRRPTPSFTHYNRLPLLSDILYRSAELPQSNLAAQHDPGNNTLHPPLPAKSIPDSYPQELPSRIFLHSQPAAPLLRRILSRIRPISIRLTRIANTVPFISPPNSCAHPNRVFLALAFAGGRHLSLHPLPKQSPTCS